MTGAEAAQAAYNQNVEEAKSFRWRGRPEFHCWHCGQDWYIVGRRMLIKHARRCGARLQ